MVSSPMFGVQLVIVTVAIVQGEVVLCQVTELSQHIVSTKPDDEFPLMDFVCIAMNDVVELLVKDVANDGSIKDLEARVIPPITASSKERRSKYCASQIQGLL